ncbi:MAG: hypothetical protein PVJ27_10145, partial [Candidatus Brocadiaceae bacterium]
MSEETPAVPDSGRSDTFGYHTALATSCVALVFCLVVVGLLVANLIRGRANDLLEPAQIELLRTQLAADPTDTKIRHQIRQRDLNLRMAYFTTRARAIQGVYMLVAGVAVFLGAMHLAARWQPRRPSPGGRRARRSLGEAAPSVASVAGLGLLMAGCLLTMVVLARHDASAEYIKAAQEAGPQESVDEPSVTVAALPPPPT